MYALPLCRLRSSKTRIAGELNGFKAAASSQVAVPELEVIVARKRFSVERIRKRQCPTYRLHDHAAGSAMDVAPQNGATLTGIHVPIQGKQRDILGAPKDCLPSDGGVPVLWPFANRIAGGVFRWGQRLHDLRGVDGIVDDGNGHAIHGMVRYQPWSVDHIGADNRAVFIRCSLKTEQCRSIERHFGAATITLTHTLSGREVRIHTEIRNDDQHAIPMSLAFHPWFRLPLSEHGSREEAKVVIPARKRWVAVDQIPTGELKDVSGKYDLHVPTRIGKNTFDDVFTDLHYRSDRGRAVTTSQLYDPASNTLIEVCASEDFRHTVLFVPQDRPRVVCVEPQTSATNAFNLQHKPEASLVILKPESPLFTATVWIRAKVDVQ
jgi:aldose 1-epimerase